MTIGKQVIDWKVACKARDITSYSMPSEKDHSVSSGSTRFRPTE